MAYILLRWMLGFNIAMHGISRLLHGPSAFAHGLVPAFAGTSLPPWSIYAFGLVLPWFETFTGLLILAGFWMRFACVFGIFQLAILTFGSSLRQDWSTVAIQLNYALIYAIVLACRQIDTLSLDERLKKNKNQ